MKKKIIIIGKNSFIGSNLFKSLKYKFNTTIYDYQKFLNVSPKLLLDVSMLLTAHQTKNM